MDKDHPEVRGPDGPRGLHVRVALNLENGPSYETGICRDSGDAHGEHDIVQAGTEYRDDHEGEDDTRERQHDIHQTHDHAFERTSKEAGDEPQWNTEYTG